MNRAALAAQLRADEAVRNKLYQDTVGKWTGGVGRNFSDRLMSPGLIQFMLDEDIDLAIDALERNAPWWKWLNDARQNVLLNMVFNMGWPRLSGFKQMLAALQAGRYDMAANEMKDSAWYNQVGDRARRLEKIMREGVL
jgi:lysozyme